MQFVCFREGQFQVVQNILGGKYASGEMLLQVLNFWRTMNPKCNAQKAFCEIIGSDQFLIIFSEKFQLLQEFTVCGHRVGFLPRYSVPGYPDFLFGSQPR